MQNFTWSNLFAGLVLFVSVPMLRTRLYLLNFQSFLKHNI